MAVAHDCECECECPCCDPPTDPPPDVSLPTGDLVLEDRAPHNHTPEGYESIPFAVTNTGLVNGGRGYLAVGGPENYNRVLLAMTGSGGASYWTDYDPGIWQQCEDLKAQGWLVIQLRWWGHWWRAADGEDAGTSGLAIRPATVIKWVHETYCDGGVVPLTLVGQSGGAAQAAYALSYYGLDDLIDRAILGAGPPMAAQEKSLAGTGAYSMNSGKLNQFDQAHGIFTGDGPAQNRDPEALIGGVRAGDRWRTSSIDTGALDLDHPTTDIWFILGDSDVRMTAVGGDYHTALATVPTNILTWQSVEGTGHRVFATQAGRDAIYSAITAP